MISNRGGYHVDRAYQADRRGRDTSLEDVRDQINSISGLNATLTPKAVEDWHVESQAAFCLQNDNSGFLTAAD